jgi:hypothetical protein
VQYDVLVPPGVDEHSFATLRKLAATACRVDCEVSLKNTWKVSSDPDSAASAAALAMLAHARLALVNALRCEDEQDPSKVFADTMPTASAKAADVNFML